MVEGTILRHRSTHPNQSRQNDTIMKAPNFIGLLIFIGLIPLGVSANSLSFPIMDCEDIDTTICSGEIFTFEGQDFSAEGTYELTSANCEGMFTLNLMVTPKPADNVTNVSICDDEVCDWGGQLYTETGTYEIIGDGCTANEVLNLTVIPEPPNIITTTTICQGEAYIWDVNEVEYTEEGVYTFETLSCKVADEILILTISERPPEIIQYESFCGGESFTWSINGLTYTEEGTYTINDCQLCGSDCTLVLTKYENCVEGTVRIDVQNDGCDENDSAVQNLIVSNSEYSVSSNNNGEFYIGNDESSMNLSSSYSYPLLDVSPQDTTVFFDSMTNRQTVNYCLSSDQIFSDLEVLLIPLENPRPGIETEYKIEVFNRGIEEATATLTLTVDTLTLESSTPSATMSSTNNIEWDLGIIQPLERKSIELILIPDVNLIDGNDIQLKASVTTTNEDVNLDNNTFILNQIIVTSFDPNDITLLEGDILPVSTIGDYVHYMIRFENIGTANANFVRLIDTLDHNSFDLRSFEPVSYSHPCEVTITDGNVLEVYYEEIELPFLPENGNTGYFIFKIKSQPTLVEGDYIRNQAEIFFDYNPPILTNLSESIYLTPEILSTDKEITHNAIKISITPNPSQDVFSVDISNTGYVHSVITIYNDHGQLMTTQTTNQSQIQFDSSGYPSGVYIVKVKIGERVVSKKLVVL